MISHRHRCIYVKVPKCASTAVRDWFLLHGAGRHSFRPSWYPGPMAHRVARVAHALELWPGYFTFAFVRDPHDRFASLWRHAERLARMRARCIAGHPASYGGPRAFAELCAELLADARGRWGRARARSCARAREGATGRSVSSCGICASSPTTRGRRPTSCRTATPSGLFGVARRNQRPLSFVGAVETIDADFARLQAQLGLPRVRLGMRNVSEAGSEGRAAGAPDAGTRRLVEEIYASDFAFIESHRNGGAAPAPRAARTGAGGGAVCAGTRARRALFVLGSLEMGLEARLRDSGAALRLLAPLARLRRRLARQRAARARSADDDGGAVVNVLVTGGAGFIGAALVRRLVAAGHRVSVVDDCSTGCAARVDAGAVLIEADIVRDDLAGVFAAAAPEAVLHLAALSAVGDSVARPCESAAVNVWGTVRVLERSAAQGVGRFVLASSGGALYGERAPAPRPPASAPAPASPYGASKAAAEQFTVSMCRLAAMRATILRYGNVYGPGDERRGEPGVVAAFARAMLGGIPPVVHGDGRQERDFVYVDDAAAAGLAALDAEGGGTFNIGSGSSRTVREVFAAVAAAAGYGGAPLHAPSRPGDVRRARLDVRRARDVLGWAARVPFAEGVARTVGAMRDRMRGAP